eukprot:4216480-Prymnesium_polylepis.1
MTHEHRPVTKTHITRSRALARSTPRTAVGGREWPCHMRPVARTSVVLQARAASGSDTAFTNPTFCD